MAKKKNKIKRNPLKYEFNGNELLQKYIDKTKNQSKLAKKALEEKNIETARKTSKDALEAIVDADIYINQHKSFVEMEEKLIIEVKKIYKETKVLIKEIYGDERPYLEGDSIAGDYF